LACSVFLFCMHIHLFYIGWTILWSKLEYTSHVLKNTHTHTHPHPHNTPPPHTHTPTPTHTHTHTPTHTQPHPHTHTHPHPHTHTDTHSKCKHLLSQTLIVKTVKVKN